MTSRREEKEKRRGRANRTSGLPASNVLCPAVSSRVVIFPETLDLVHLPLLPVTAGPETVLGMKAVELRAAVQGTLARLVPLYKRHRNTSHQ